MDRLGVDYEKAFKSILERLTPNALAVNIPIGAESKFEGVIDLVTMKAIYFEGEQGEIISVKEIPADLMDKAKEYRKVFIEKIAEQDVEVLTDYLEKEIEPSEDKVREILRKATIAGIIIPVFCGSSFKNKGIQPLLDGIVEYMPSPLDLPPVQGIHPKTGEAIVCPPDDKAPFAALVFKVANDPYVGTLNYFRVYSGVFKKGNYLLNASKSSQERIGRLLQMHSNKREELEEIRAGDIAATVGLKNTNTGDTLCDPNHPVILEKIEFPEPVISIKVEPQTKADQEKMSLVLKKLSEEDPTFTAKSDQETSETIISGMGEFHLEILVDRMKREFNLNVKTGRPQVAYKETIRKTVESEGKYIRQSGGRGQYGHVLLRLEPLERGKGFEFVDIIKGGVIPKEYIPAVEKGIKEALEKGILAGYPISDIRVTLYDGSFHEVDSSDFAFKIAGSMAFQDGAKRASPVLLEPIMKLEVVIPEQNLGDVTGDISSKRGMIESIGERTMMKIILAKVPLAEMFGFATKLRSLTEGRGVFTMEFDHYQEVPDNITQEIIGKEVA